MRVDRVLQILTGRAAGRAQASIAVPPLPEHTQLQELETALGVQAILVVHAPELDLRAWGETVAQMEEAGMLAGG